jgi:two-component system cell cycle response regulator
VNEEQTVIHKRVPMGGAPRERNASLLVLSGRALGQLFKLPPGEVVLGRSTEADIRLDDEGVSRLHAKIRRRTDGTVEVADLDSTNGTYVNGAQIRHFTLSDGDRIQIGSVTILQFRFQDSLEEQLQEQLRESVIRDPLTQAYNKRYFTEQLEKDFSHALRHHLPLSLVMLDVDHFKNINDSHGHPAGDHVLQRLSATIMATLRTEDAFCRVGGEEFAVIMRDCTEPEGLQLAERLRRLVASTQFVYGGKVLPVTVSLGVSSFDPARHPSTLELIAEADRCLYEAKRRGRNRACHPLDLSPAEHGR